jgi:hypothetical protein
MCVWMNVDTTLTHCGPVGIIENQEGTTLNKIQCKMMKYSQGPKSTQTNVTVFLEKSKTIRIPHVSSLSNGLRPWIINKNWQETWQIKPLLHNDDF